MQIITHQPDVHPDWRDLASGTVTFENVASFELEYGDETELHLVFSDGREETYAGTGLTVSGATAETSSDND